MIELIKLLLGLVRSFFRPDVELILENLALRHQLQIALRSHPRPRPSNRDRFLWVSIRRVFPPSWKRCLVVVRPETVISWHRRVWRLYWTWRSRSRVGRPRLAPEVRDLIAQMASEKSDLGNAANPRRAHEAGHHCQCSFDPSVSQANLQSSSEPDLRSALPDRSSPGQSLEVSITSTREPREPLPSFALPHV
jgi:hypothetical protein